MEKEIIKYKIKNFRKMKTLDDFYKPLGLLGRLTKNEITIHDVHMDREECEMLNDFMKKNNESKHRAKKYTDMAVGIHWIQFSPSCKGDTPKGELWIYKDEQ